MLKSASAFDSDILIKYARRMYDLDYQYYYAAYGTELPTFPEDNFDEHFFASVDSYNEVLGIIRYDIDISTRSCTSFSIMSFYKGNLKFVRDVKQAVDDIFYKYKFDRLGFYCLTGNPVLKNYRRFIQKHGGREVGTYRKCSRLMNGELQDMVLFEILREEYKK